MSDTPVPDAAVQIVEEALCGGGEEQHSVHVTHPDVARAALTALATAGWLHDPAEILAERKAADARTAGLKLVHDELDDQVDWGGDEPIAAALLAAVRAETQRGPRVWLPGDTIPADVWTRGPHGDVTSYDLDEVIDPDWPEGAYVEVFVPCDDDFADAVAAERARRAADDGEVAE